MTGFAVAWTNRGRGWDASLALSLAVALGLAIAILPVVWTAIVLVGGIVVVLILVRPLVGVLLLIPAVPFGSLRQVSLGGLNVGLADLLLGLVLFGWLGRMVARSEVRVRWPALSLPLLIWLGAMLLSLPQATSWQHSVKEVLKWLEVLALLVLVAQEADERWARRFAFCFLATGALAALHGIYQFLFQVGPEAFVLFGRFMRAYGTFEQPNPYGGYLGLTLPLAIGLLLGRLGYRWPHGLGEARASMGWGWTVWAAACGGLILTALIMSWSRGAWLGFVCAVALMVLAIIARSGRMAVLGAVVTVVVAYAFLAGGLVRVPEALLQRFSDFVPFVGTTDIRGVEVTDANYAVVERVAHWQAAAAMWTDHPWVGVGVGNYELAYPRYALPGWPLPLGHAHNYYLNVAAETGLLGLVSYLGFWGAALVTAWRTTARKPRAAKHRAAPQDPWNWGLALGTLGMIAHLSVHNLVDNLFVHDMYLQVAVLLGLMCAWARTPAQAPSRDQVTRSERACPAPGAERQGTAWPRREN